jgi:hypothetical protein
MIQASTQFPSIDYTAHPAFRQFSPADPSQDTAIEQAVRQIDEVLEEIHASPAALSSLDIEHAYQTRALPQLETVGRSLTALLPGDLPIATIATAARPAPSC